MLMRPKFRFARLPALNASGVHGLMPHDAADVTDREVANTWNHGRPPARHRRRAICNAPPPRPAERSRLAPRPGPFAAFLRTFSISSPLLTIGPF
jgi:hypothetical protein